MIPFLAIVAVIAYAALAANAFLNVLGRSAAALLVGGTFVVVSIGAYAASFVIDMVVLAWSGEVPATNVLLCRDVARYRR
jgi:hypothetical protein